MKKSENKTYGYLKDGTPLTESLAQEIVSDAFDALEAGKCRIIKAPANSVRIKTSVAKLPEELQRAAQYR